MDLEENARLTLKIYGRVQGVGFRFGVLKQAESLRLGGWVRNAPDGTVEIAAEGEKETLERFLDWCREGPSYARVDKVEVEWGDYRGEFEIFAVTQ